MAGYIGSHTCVELLNSGYEVIVVDNFSNSNPESLKRVQELTGKYFEFYEIDILEKVALEKVFSENNIQAVIHFAGFKSVGQSLQITVLYYHNNITGTLYFVKRYNVKKLVFSSSATVYGTPKSVLISEHFPLSATNPYGRTKLIIETILQDIYASDKQWSVAILRYFNPIGAHESGRIGEDSSGIPNNLMPFITQVADIAKGDIKALEKIIKTRGIEPYNLGTGVGYSGLDLVGNFQKVTNIKIPYVIVDRRIGDISKCYADPIKAKTILKCSAEKNIQDTYSI